MKRIHDKKSAVLLAISLIVYILSLFALGYNSYTQKFFDALFLNSDTVGPTLFFNDMFKNNVAFYDWKLQHSFLLFPEFSFLLIIKAIFGENLGLVNYVTSLLTFVAVQLGVLLLLQKVFLVKPKRFSLYFVALAAANLLLSTKPLLLFYYMSMAPHFHVGTVFNVCVSYVLFLKLKNTTRPLGLFLFTLLIFIFSLSDPLFVFFFVIPVSAVLLRHKALRAHTKILICMWGAVFLAFVMYLNLPFTGIEAKNTIFRLPSTFFDLYVSLGWIKEYVKVLNPLFIISCVLILGFLSFAKLYKKTPQKGQVTFFAWYLLFLLFSCVYVYISHSYKIILDYRLFYPLLIIMFYLPFYYLSTLVHSYKLEVVLVFMVVCGGLLRITHYSSIFTKIGISDTQLAKCVSTHVHNKKLQHGLGEFWIAYNIKVFENDTLNIVPVYQHKDGKYYLYNIFGPKVSIDQMRFDYFVTNFYITKTKIEKWLGPPISVHKCSETVFVLEYSDATLKSGFTKRQLIRK